MTKRVGELEVDEDLRLQRRAWRTERIAWVVMGLLVALSIAGLFGTGPLSWSSQRTDSITVSYERFARLGSQSRLKVEVGAAPGPSPRVAILVDRDFLEETRVQQVTPTPDAVEHRPGAVLYVFAAPAGGALVATLDLVPNSIGRVEGWVGLEGGERVVFSQFVYP